MFSFLWDVFFGCRHRNYSFPITTKSLRQRSDAAAATGTYVVCLDCGQEFGYDWQRMKVVSRIARKPAPVTSAAHSFATK